MEDAVNNPSNINPVALLFLLAMGYFILSGRRQVAVKALLAMAAFLPLAQQVVIMGLHFSFLRILILVGLCRVLSRGEARQFQWQSQDKLFLGWALVGLFFGILRSPTAELFGTAYNCIGIYFLIRCLTREAAEVVEHLRFLAFAVIVIAAAMAVELATHRNPFFVFGGVPEFVVERDGRFRCQGPFRVCILAGTFAATLFPLLLGVWRKGGRDKKLALFGIAACAFSTCAAASSGALITCVIAIIGSVLWPLRNHMRWIRRGIVVTIVGLAVVMNAPVWFLIAKLSDLLGGTGWYRSNLIQQAIYHFNEWWLIGSSYTANWSSGQPLPGDPNNVDITNEYIAEGLQGGLLRLGLFLAIIVSCFKKVGRAVHAERTDSHTAKLWWAIGVCLSAHCAAFISISYFDQIQVFWFWLWAVIAVLPLKPVPVAVLDENPLPEQDSQTAQVVAAKSKSPIGESEEELRPA
jgi:hypothetical protein